MLISHRHRFLFVHIAKTGGTSIRAALRRGRWLDPWTWPTYACHRLSHISGHRIGCKLPRHAAAVVAQGMLPPDFFQSLFKFAFVRDPWDRMLSAYGHFQGEHPEVLREHGLDSFSQFTRWALCAPLETVSRPALVLAVRRPQYDHLIDVQGELLVDYVGRFEHLEEHFRIVCQKLGWQSSRLGHRRRSAKKVDYRSAYDERLAEEVGEHFRRDAAAFDYAFDAQNALTDESPVILPIEAGRALMKKGTNSRTHGTVREVS